MKPRRLPVIAMSLFERLFGSRPEDPPESRHPAERQAAVDGSPSAHEAARLLRAPTALMQLSAAEALTVVGFMRPRRFASGTTIIRQGEATDTGFMVLVLDGEITVETLIARRSNPVTVTVLGPGSLIGEMSLVDGAARSASCTASSDVRCAVLTREALEALIAELPATAAKLMAAVAQRLAERLRDSGHKLKIYSQLVQTMQQGIDALMPTPDRRL
jgi:CRP-like cAMP-binding protein